MLDKSTLLNVTNRYDGSIGYTVPDLQITRHFEPNETKEVSFEEILKLSYQPGGMPLLRDCIIMDNADAVREILGEVEPEYFYTKEDVKNLLLKGTLAQLEDCLDFADDGVISLVKRLAVDLEINDISKREAIKEKTGFDVNNAIQINKETSEENEAPEKTARRAAPIKSETSTTQRRTAAPKYKIVSQQ